MENRKIIKQIAIDALFIALLVIFTFVPYVGFIQIGPISFTTIHILVLIGAAFYGIKRGTLYGFIFGLLSLIKALQFPTTVDYLFVNPFISILPRVIFGLVSGVIFDLLRKKASFKVFAITLPFICTILTFFHSVVTLSSLYVFGIKNVFNISSWLGLGNLIEELLSIYPTFTGFILANVTLGALFEAVSAAIIVPPIYLIVNKIYHINCFEKNNENKRKGAFMEYKKLVKDYETEATKTLRQVIQIDSVYDESSVNQEMPYGKGVHKIMAFMQKLALKDGFEVDMCDGHCIEISCGEGDHVVGIFAHLDEVPVSGEWKYPPFGGEIHDGKMYGRGTSDDKGPAIAAYYALKALKDNNLIKGFKVKLVLGGDEERGSSCLEYYFHELKKPDVSVGFTPDGDFPLIYGEKGIRDYILHGKVDLTPVLAIKAGVAPNAVIDSAIVKVKDGEKLKDYLKAHKEINYKILSEDKDVVEVEFVGVSAHGSTPELGINSGMIMLKTLNEVYNISLLKKLYDLYEDPNGKTMDSFYETKYLGVTTYNVGMINYEKGEFKFVVNFRFPENVDSDEVIDKVGSLVSELEVTKDKPQSVVYFDPETTPFILALAKVYVDETGDTINKPMAIGGGTYAKEAKNIVAFGSHFPGKEDHIHGANEKIDMEDFYLSITLYAHAIVELGKLK